MKRILTAVLVLLMCMTLILSLCACEKPQKEEPTEAIATEPATEAIDPLWEEATYLEDTVLGEGATSINVKVEAGEKAVTFEINTDAKNLEDALLGVNLIEGEEGAYGLYIKKVNGITADYDVDKSYWAMYKDSEYLMESAKDTQIATGDSFELIYTK